MIISSQSDKAEGQTRFAEVKKTFGDLEDSFWIEEVAPNRLFNAGSIFAKIRLTDLDPDQRFEPTGRLRRLRDTHERLSELLAYAEKNYPRPQRESICDRIRDMLDWLERELVLLEGPPGGPELSEGGWGVGWGDR